jgi:hypothetical protein
MFDKSGKGALVLADFIGYANSSESALGEVPYGAHAIGPEAALEVRASRIPGAALGLFSTTDIAARSVICEYTGSELTLVEVAFLEDRTYLMGRIGADMPYRPARAPARAVAVHQRWGALPARPPSKGGGSAEIQNARFEQMPSRRRVCVLAMRAIASYGPCYWVGATPHTPPSRRFFSTKQ